MSRKPAHLLLVDDDPGLLKLLGMRLTSEGYSALCGHHAIAFTGQAHAQQFQQAGIIIHKQ